MSDTRSGDNLLGQAQAANTSVERSADPLPWLIHNLREKRAELEAHERSEPTTERAREAH